MLGETQIVASAECRVPSEAKPYERSYEKLNGEDQARGSVFGGPRVLVALHRGSSWIGKLIEWQTRSHYSHAALVFAGPGEELEHTADRNRPARLCEVVESREFHGVRITDGIVREPHTAVDLFSVPLLTTDQTSRLREFAHQHIGKPYDYLSVARFISRRSESIHSKEKWFCSEFVFAAFQAAGLGPSRTGLLRDTEAWEVSPGLLSKSPLLHPEGTLPAACVGEAGDRGIQIPHVWQEPALSK